MGSLSMRLVATLLACCLADCGRTETRDSRLQVSVGSVQQTNCEQTKQTAAVAQEARELTADTKALATKVNTLTAEVALLLRDFASAEAAFDAATATFQRATRIADTSSSAFISAQEDFRTAERNYRWMSYVLIAAATFSIGDALCGSVESTASFRCVDGVCLPSNLHIDHAFPHSLGGANVPANYQVLPAAENLALGNSFWAKLLATPIPVLKGMTASALMWLRCPGNPAAWSR